MKTSEQLSLYDKFTPEQREVILSRGKNLLVSASAGSGKTLTMIQRIIDMIKNKDVSVEDILVVTFTKSAAGEMKERLIKGLEEVEPKDDFIKEQLLLVASSSISTLHSFCAKLLKTYFYMVGLDPSFILIDELEANALKNKALTRLIDSRFILKDDRFFELLDIFSINRHEENFKEIILKVYEYLLTETRGEEWLKGVIKKAHLDKIDGNICAWVINSYVARQVNLLKKQADELLFKLSGFGASKLIEVVNSVYINLLKIKENATITQNIKALEGFEKIKDIPRKVDAEHEELKLEVKAFKEKYNSVKAAIEKELDSDIFDGFEEKMRVTRIRVEALVEYAKLFKEIYSGLKKERVALDFSDLEEYALKLLDIKEVREAVQDKYKYVFIDEYQDTNMVQEEIVKRVTRENNLFMVGDVKQSIYKFRASEPEIFVNKYNKYKESGGAISEAINLNHNFRSHQDILNFANFVFSLAMTDEFGKINYKRDALLIKGDKPYPVVSDFPIVKIDLYEKTKKDKNSEAVILDDYSVKNHKNADVSSLKKAEKEGKIIAKNIKEIVGKEIYDAKNKTTRRVEFSDIALLTASRGEHLEVVLKELNAENIPYTSDVAISVFDDNHLSTIKGVLSLAHNPFDDISLLAVLNSEMFDFSVDDLAKIRYSYPNERHYYEALIKLKTDDSYIDKKLKKKVVNFYEALERFNYLSKILEVDELITKIVGETGYYNKILKSDNGEKSVSILNKLIAFLSGKSYNTNLTKFLDYIKENSIEFQLDTSLSGVKVTTIHKSKGLEYPVVILMGVGQEMLRRNQGEFVVNKNLGFGIDFYDTKKRTKQKTIVKNAIKLENIRAEKEEKLRLLYVAITRAVNHLIIVGEAKPEIPSSAEDATTFFDFIMPAVQAYTNGEFNEKINLKVDIAKVVDGSNETKSRKIKDIKLVAPNTKLVNEILKSIGYKYPHLSLVDMPVKTSVSEILAEGEGDYVVPSAFNSDTSVVDAVEKGLAYHKLMQLISLRVRTKEALVENINVLIKSGKISIEEVKRVNLDSVLRLLTNPKFDELSRATVLREQEFIALSKFGKGAGAGSVILQGVVDFIAITSKGIVVGDYKTNNYKTEAKFIEKYKKQLDIYSEVVKESLGMPVVEKFIYSFNLNKFIKV